jgi:hypothetical protein
MASAVGVPAQEAGLGEVNWQAKPETIIKMTTPIR